MSEEQEHVKEVIIVKRRKDHGHDDHHGGVWKIAFADFMTAMMAFFLVLWIVNSTSKETQAAIARYFNPVKITDTTPARKGLQDPRNTDFDASLEEPNKKVVEPLPDSANTPPATASKEGKAAIGAEGSGTSKTPPKTPGIKPTTLPSRSGDRTTTSAEQLLEARLFDDPDTVLTEILAADAESALKSAKDSDQGQSQFNDPFAPVRPTVAQAPPRPGPALQHTQPATAAVTQADQAQKPAQLQNVANDFLRRQMDVAAMRIAESMSAAIEAAFQETLPPGQQPKVAIKSTAEGVLINLSDSGSFSMFGVGSATPNAKAIIALEQIGRLLAKQQGSIIVRGHTDARPFKPGVSDNWRLSTSRAQMAFYMLKRGGLDESRLKRLEGHASHAPLVSANPLAAENRRIEVLLKSEAAN